MNFNYIRRGTFHTLFKINFVACPHLKRGFGNVPHCQETDDGHKICTVACRPGYAFLPGNTPLPEYKCGKNTTYIWNGKPPSCGSMYDQSTTCELPNLTIIKKKRNQIYTYIKN